MIALVPPIGTKNPILGVSAHGLIGEIHEEDISATVEESNFDDVRKNNI